MTMWPTGCSQTGRPTMSDATAKSILIAHLPAITPQIVDPLRPHISQLEQGATLKATSYASMLTARDVKIEITLTRLAMPSPSSKTSQEEERTEYEQLWLQ